MYLISQMYTIVYVEGITYHSKISTINSKQKPSNHHAKSYPFTPLR
jgi:hypothetical protein